MDQVSTQIINGRLVLAVAGLSAEHSVSLVMADDATGLSGRERDRLEAAIDASFAAVARSESRPMTALLAELDAEGA